MNLTLHRDPGIHSHGYQKKTAYFTMIYHDRSLDITQISFEEKCLNRTSHVTVWTYMPLESEVERMLCISSWRDARKVLVCNSGKLWHNFYIKLFTLHFLSTSWENLLYIRHCPLDYLIVPSLLYLVKKTYVIRIALCFKI